LHKIQTWHQQIKQDLIIGHISNKEIKVGESIQAKDLREVVFKRILADNPDFDKEQYITIDELNKYRRMELFYRTLGEGQPVIILHGLMGSSDNWLTVSKPLAEQYKIYLVDQRNHGRSPWDNTMNYEVMANDLWTFITQHQIEKPVIIGHSMGGKVAMKFATEHPDLIAKLIVVDIAPRYYPPHHQDVLKGLHAITLANLQNRTEADQILATAIDSADVRQFLLKNLYRNEENQFAWRINLAVIDQQIDQIGEALLEHVRFDKPSLFIAGALSDYITAADKAMITSIFTNSKIVTIDNANHWVQATQPAAFLAEVTAFIDQK
jgi:esterase